LNLALIVDIHINMSNVDFLLNQFTDYRAFLLGYFNKAQKRNPRFSYGSWAKALGLSDTSSITKIIKGQRDPGPLIVEKLIDYFNFDEKEALYFKDLIRLHKIKQDTRLSVLLIEKMNKVNPKSGIRVMDENTFSILSHWYCLAIREMVRLDHFFEDPEWISNQLQFSVEPVQTKAAIEALLKTNLLARNELGELVLSQEGRLTTKNDLANQAIQLYHMEMLNNAQKALTDIPVFEREFSSSSFVMRKENINMAKELIRDFKKKFVRLLEEDKGNGVFQIQMQFFPLTKMNNKKNNKH